MTVKTMEVMAVMEARSEQPWRAWRDSVMAASQPISTSSRRAVALTYSGADSEAPDTQQREIAPEESACFERSSAGLCRAFVRSRPGRNCVTCRAGNTRGPRCDLEGSLRGGHEDVDATARRD